MDSLGPTPEALQHDIYEPPHRSQTTNRTAWRKRQWYERITGVEPVHAEAAKTVEKHYQGSLGYDVRSLEIPSAAPDCPYGYEQPIVYYGMLFRDARKAVAPRAWCALMTQIDDDPRRHLTPTEIGHQWAGYKTRAQAKVYGDTLILAALDQLVMHYRLIRRPDG